MIYLLIMDTILFVLNHTRYYLKIIQLCENIIFNINIIKIDEKSRVFLKNCHSIFVKTPKYEKEVEKMYFKKIIKNKINDFIQGVRDLLLPLCLQISQEWFLVF